MSLHKLIKQQSKEYYFKPFHISETSVRPAFAKQMLVKLQFYQRFLYGSAELTYKELIY